MNKYGHEEDFITPKEYKDFIENNLGEWSALLENEMSILVEKNGDTDYNLAFNEFEKNYSSLDELFEDKVINGKSLNDFKRIDLICI